jgi:hypothetical protein
VSAPHKAELKIYHFTSFVLQLKSIFLVRRLFLLIATFTVTVLNLICLPYRINL